MADVEAGGAGEEVAGVSRNGTSNTREIPRPNGCFCCAGLEMICALPTVLRARLGDGITRVKAGERLDHTGVLSSRDWREGNRFMHGLQCKDGDRPAHPQELASGKEWLFVAPDSTIRSIEENIVETREIDVNLENVVVVFREGLAMPTRELLRVVNTAHAVLVLRGSEEYFYLRDDFVLSTREEEALVEWGVGRPLLANSGLAVGGTLMVAYAEQVWGPAIVGTLLVATAEYRIQGALTNVLRVRSVAWSEDRLVPSGIHGAERVAQLVMVVLVALADLLDNRALLLATLICASVQVVFMESVGQVVLTWGFSTYIRTLGTQAAWSFAVCVASVAWLCLTYCLAGFFGASIFIVALNPLVSCCYVGVTKERVPEGVDTLKILISVAASCIHCIISIAKSLGKIVDFAQWSQPWRWPLFRAPDSYWEGVRVVGLWFGALTNCMVVVFIVVGLFSFSISSDRAVGEKTRARKELVDIFSHYHKSSIPSRNLLVPSIVGKQTRDVGQQTQPAPAV